MSEPLPKLSPWEDFILRLIAAYKLFHAVFFTAVGFGLLKLRHHNVVEVLTTYVVDPYRLYFPYHLNPEDRAIDWLLAKAGTVSPHMIFLLGWASFFYAALFLTEGLGLYLRKKWAEYFVVIVTGSLLPVEAYELWVKLAWWKFAAVVGNLLIVAYLIHRLRLDARVKAQRVKDNAKTEPLPPTDPSGPAHDRESSEDKTQPPATSKRVITKVS